MEFLGIDTLSDSVQVRKLLPQIEAELEAGARRQQVYEAIKAKYDLTFTYEGFLTALKRARKIAGENEGYETVESSGESPDIVTPKEKETTEARQDKPKRGIIGKTDFKPSADIDDKLTELTGKNRKY